MFVKNKLYYEKKLKSIERKQEADRRLFYSKIIHKNDLVFDVGANIGNRTSIFLELGAKVVAVEPQPHCAGILKEKFNGSIFLEQIGLDEKDDTLTMYIADESTISTFSKEYIDLVKDTKFKRNTWEKTITVPVTRIDNLIDKYGMPTFCKIDVEGYELNVLKGLSKPIPLISFEYSVPELTHKMNACLQYLSALDSRYRFNYSYKETMEMNLNKWYTYEEMMAVIATDSFKTSEFGDIYVKLFA